MNVISFKIVFLLCKSIVIVLEIVYGCFSVICNFCVFMCIFFMYNLCISFGVIFMGLYEIFNK